MKKYTRPNAEIAKFAIEDIITASGVTAGTNGVIVGSGELAGADAEMYAVYSKNSEAQNKKVSVFTW